jgi:tetratricopeptide (TPR) repeat protein
VSLDRLERATHALRETTSSEASRTNAAALGRGLDRLEHPKPAARLSMRHVRIVAWTLAASLLGVGAWASATGRVNWFVPEPASAPPAEPAAAPPKLAARERAHRRAVPADDGALAAEPEPPAETPAPPAEPPAVAPAPVPPPVSAPASSDRPRRTPPVPARAAAPPSPDADALYRAAHQAHFARADYAQALALWDRYLAEAEPGHRWTIEARYNRGIALYRLGQAERAREALEPFARGEYGGYRRADARRLLEALPR